MALARPLNLLTLFASFMKSVLLLLAYSLVFIVSTGNNAKSMEVPAIPPASTETKKVLVVNVFVTTYGLFSAI